MIKVCHMTSAHNSDDVRIFFKECSSLATAGYDVYLVARGDSREENGVHVIGLGQAPDGRLKRMFGFTRSVYKKALSLGCDIYHFHDPELLMLGLKLSRSGKKVVFDSHEDVPQQILDKTWIPKTMRNLVSRTYKLLETLVSRRIDAVVTATPYIKERFFKRSKFCVDICNFPLLNDVLCSDQPIEKRERIVCYAGGISENRGEHRMLEAMRDVDGTLLIAGKKDGIEKSGLQKNNVKYLGELNRSGINSLYSQSVVGLVLLSPIGNYINSLPVKMFEYMAAGLPFVCSDFPLWKEIVENTNAGICVNQDDIAEISDAISKLLNDRELSKKMGKSGRTAVLTDYNWANESKKLIHLYERLL